MGPIPNPPQPVREIKDPVGLAVAGTNLVAHEPRHAVGGVAEKIGEWNAALSDELVAEDDAVVSELEPEEKVATGGIGGAAPREESQIETHFVVPFGVVAAVAIAGGVPVCWGSLLLLLFLGELTRWVVALDGNKRIEG